MKSSRTFTNTSSSFAPIDSFAPAHSGIRPAHCAALGAGSELVVLAFEQDVERGERSVTARDILLQIELVRIAQFAWHAIASAKEGRSRSPSARELADYSES
jgi:hypothetical protein